MKVEEVDRPLVRGKYKHLVEQALALPPNKAIRISGISLKEANSIRQAGFRNGLRSLVQAEDEAFVLVLYPKSAKGE